MVRVGLPAPTIFAPIALRKLAKSTTSGSQAALSITVIPSASVAAIITLAVPSTVEPARPPRNISAPTSRLALASTYPFSTLSFAPKAAKPLRCRLIGRAPMMHPPGSETVAFFSRPSRGPMMQMEPRILRTRS